MSQGVRVTFLGTGDPFGTGGRLQSSILVDGPDARFLLDCGATTPVALARAGIDPVTIDGIVVTHWHGDHIGGAPPLLLDALVGSRQGVARPPRKRPLWIAGPIGTRERLRDLQAVFEWMPAAGSDGADPLAAVLEDIPLVPGEPVQIGPVTILATRAAHTPEALSVRVEVAGRAIAYSGDTAWTDDLLRLAHEADLFICQTYTFEIEHAIMLSYRRLASERHRLTSRRLILTHVGPELQARLAEVNDEQIAEDGLTLDL